MRILCVDDDPDWNVLVSHFLELSGYEVVCAEGAESALALVEQQPVDLVITDLSMPGIDGAKFIETLKQNPRYRNVPVILITAYHRDTRTEQSLRHGAAFVLPKPVDLEHLLALVRFAE